ncbi:hypothetical protein BV25DRAFT_729518 [Artomyces pyxidatus]|uniref:Uncharacterized protein n=1 Tax=Artomyces pyxidatus TaxID=48021 RepID=A0ACB8T0J4_9AGAM|nr:hypothetical protein BV25DRAFT_729518 [Artomyces pyxidatus]
MNQSVQSTKNRRLNHAAKAWQTTYTRAPKFVASRPKAILNYVLRYTALQDTSVSTRSVVVSPIHFHLKGACTTSQMSMRQRNTAESSSSKGDSSSLRKISQPKVSPVGGTKNPLLLQKFYIGNAARLFFSEANLLRSPGPTPDGGPICLPSP